MRRNREQSEREQWGREERGWQLCDQQRERDLKEGSSKIKDSFVKDKIFCNTAGPLDRNAAQGGITTSRAFVFLNMNPASNAG